MREDNYITQTLLDAQSSIAGFGATARLTFYNNRSRVVDADFSNVTYDFSPTTNELHITDIQPQDIEYYTTGSKLITCFRASDFGIHMLVQGDATDIVVTEGEAQIMSVTRPTIVLPYLFAERAAQTGQDLKRHTMDMSLILAGDGECITATELIANVPANATVALMGLSATQCLHVAVDEGGLKLTYYERTAPDTWVADVCPSRLMYPERVWTYADRKKATFSDALLTSNGVYFYITHDDGSVIGVHRNTAGAWSDFFTAVPQDLSLFLIANVFEDSTGNIHLIGQFVRKDPNDETLYLPVVYTLDLWSTDGRIFSMDRFTYLAVSKRRIFVLPVGTNNLHADCNRIATHAGYWPTHHTSTPGKVIVEPEQISSLDYMDNSANVVFSPTSGLAYSALTEPGQIAFMEVGVLSAGATPPSEYEWIPVGRFIVARRTDKWMTEEDKRRVVTLESETYWRARIMSYPLYLEFQSKQSILDLATEMGNLYDVPGSSGSITPLTAEFLENGEARAPQALDTNKTVEYYTDDLKSQNILTGYPVIATLPFEIQIFCWSRIGVPTTNPNSPGSGPAYDPTSSAKLNDNFQPIVVIEKVDGTQNTIVIPWSAATTDPYPPQHWKEGNSRYGTGDLPIKFNARAEDGFAAGDKILKLGVRVSNPNLADGPTLHHVERIDIPSMTMSIMTSDGSNWGELKASERVTIAITDDSTFSPYKPPTWTAAVTSGSWSNGQVVNTGTGSITATLQLTASEKFMWSRTTFDFIVKTLGTVGQSNYGIVTEIILYKENVEQSRYTVTAVQGTSYNLEERYTIPVWADTPLSIDKIVFTQTVTKTGSVTAALDNFNITFGDLAEVAHAISLVAHGEPKILWSNKPYSAFNFQASCSYDISANCWGGVVGLSSDAQNYIAARANSTSVQLIKVRAGITTVLDSASYSPTRQDTGWEINVLLEHRDGRFRVFVKDFGITDWNAPVIDYSWTAADGQMAIGDLFHVGVYGFIDVPKFRILPFDPASGDCVAMAPGQDPAILDDFASSGVITIDGIDYAYGSKTAQFTPRGPFQYRNTGVAWSYTNPSSSISFGGNSCDITMFAWQAAANLWASRILTTDSYINSLITTTDWRPFVSTGGETTYLLNRSRQFCSTSITGSASDRAWVSCGLVNVTKLADQLVHPYGSWCYQKSEKAVVALKRFAASSGDTDATIEDLVTRILKMAGGVAVFPGDSVKVNQSLNGVEVSI